MTDVVGFKRPIPKDMIHSLQFTQMQKSLIYARVILLSTLTK